MCNKNSGVVESLVAFALGVVIGGTIAALATPSTGEELRGELKNQYNDNLHKADSLSLKIKDSIYEFQMLSKETAEHFVKNLGVKLDNISKRFNDITNTGAEVLIEDEIL